MEQRREEDEVVSRRYFSKYPPALPEMEYVSWDWIATAVCS
jgi:hypothetical protein